MTLQGTVMNGVVVLDAAAKLPEGTRVQVITTEKPSSDRIRAVRGRFKHLKGAGTEALLKDRHEDSGQ